MTFERVLRGEVVNEWVQIEPRGEQKRVYLSHKLVHLGNGDPCILTEALKEPLRANCYFGCNLASTALFDKGALRSYNLNAGADGERELRLRIA